MKSNDNPFINKLKASLWVKGHQNPKMRNICCYRLGHPIFRFKKGCSSIKTLCHNCIAVS